MEYNPQPLTANASSPYVAFTAEQRSSWQQSRGAWEGIKKPLQNDVGPQENPFVSCNQNCGTSLYPDLCECSALGLYMDFVFMHRPAGTTKLSPTSPVIITLMWPTTCPWSRSAHLISTLPCHKRYLCNRFRMPYFVVVIGIVIFVVVFVPFFCLLTYLFVGAALSSAFAIILILGVLYSLFLSFSRSPYFRPYLSFSLISQRTGTKCVGRELQYPGGWQRLLPCIRDTIRG